MQGRFPFGQVNPKISQIFYASQLSRCVVNLKPVVPGHVLVLPIRVVPRFKDLTSEEVCDLWLTAQKIGIGLEKYYNANAMSFIIQDGPASGQTIHHVHIHVIPRIEGVSFTLSEFETKTLIYFRE